MKRAKIHDLHILIRRRRVIVRLKRFDWPSLIGLRVDIECGPETVSARQVGFGNLEDFATVELALTGPWDEDAPKLRSFTASREKMFLTRSSSGNAG
jgi:hypothetical protein